MRNTHLILLALLAGLLTAEALPPAGELKSYQLLPQTTSPNGNVSMTSTVLNFVNERNGVDSLLLPTMGKVPPHHALCLDVELV